VVIATFIAKFVYTITKGVVVKTILEKERKKGKERMSLGGEGVCLEHTPLETR